MIASPNLQAAHAAWFSGPPLDGLTRSQLVPQGLAASGPGISIHLSAKMNHARHYGIAYRSTVTVYYIDAVSFSLVS
jgi:hypothetical protein